MPIGFSVNLPLCQPLSEAKRGLIVRITGRLTSILRRSGLKEEQYLQESLTFQKQHFPKQEQVVTTIVSTGYVIISLDFYPAS